MINQGKLDIAYTDIFSRPGEYARELGLFDIQPVFTEKLVLTGSKTYANRMLTEQPNFERLVSCDFISYQKHSPAIQSWFRHHFHKTSVTVKTVLTVESVKGVVNGIKNNLGLGIVPSHLIQHEIEAGEIIPVKTTTEDLLNRISLVRLLDKIPSLTEKEFLRHFQKYISGIKK